MLSDQEISGTCSGLFAEVADLFDLLLLEQDEGFEKLLLVPADQIIGDIGVDAFQFTLAIQQMLEDYRRLRVSVYFPYLYKIFVFVTRCIADPFGLAEAVQIHQIHTFQDFQFVYQLFPQHLHCFF